MRLFTGLSIGEPALSNLDRILEALRPVAAVNWSPIANLHITTKFIGEWAENRLSELHEVLASIESPGAIPIHIRGFGFFPDSSRPKTLYAGVQAGATLFELASRIEGALATIGCARELRPYSPHVTLARIRQTKTDTLREYIASMADLDFESFTAAEFHLYLSKAGSVYERLSSYPLVSAA